MLTRVTLWSGAVVFGVGLVWLSNSYLLRQEPKLENPQINLADTDLTPEAASTRPFSEFVSNELPKTRVEVAREKALAEVNAQIDEMRSGLLVKGEPKEKVAEEKPVVVVADPVSSDELLDEPYNNGSMLFASAVLPRVNAASGGSQSASGLVAHRSSPAASGGSGGPSGGSSGGGGSAGTASSNPATGVSESQADEEPEEGPTEDVAANQEDEQAEDLEGGAANENGEPSSEADSGEENTGNEVADSNQETGEEQQSKPEEEEEEQQGESQKPESELLAQNDTEPKDEAQGEPEQQGTNGENEDDNQEDANNPGESASGSASGEDPQTSEEESLAIVDEPEEEQSQGDDDQQPPASSPVEEDIEQLVGDILDEGFTEPEQDEEPEDDPFEEQVSPGQEPNTVAVSEPGSIMLFLMGLIGLVFSRRRMK